MDKRKLDALVAQEMGWTGICELTHEITGRAPGTRWPNRIPHYTTDISAAWPVVEWMIKGKPWECYIEHQFDGWDCCFTHPGAKPGEGHGQNAPEAICLAFLRACGVEIGDEEARGEMG